jgi:hypothetical protein
VEQGGAVLVEHALGIAGRAARVAEHHRLALVALDPGIILVLGGDQGVELAIVEADIMLDRRPARLQPLDHRREGLVVEQHPVLGMVADIDELLVEQARVDGVEDPAGADRAVPGDEVAAVVHRERPDPVALS